MTSAICAGERPSHCSKQENLPVARLEATKRLVHHGLLPVD